MRYGVDNQINDIDCEGTNIPYELLSLSLWIQATNKLIVVN